MDTCNMCMFWREGAVANVDGEKKYTGECENELSMEFECNTWEDDTCDEFVERDE